MCAALQDSSGVGDAAPGRARGALLRLTAITKRFPGVLALSEVDFELRAGEVHVLFGENGAGKSTLINVVAGTFPPDAGTFEYRGERVAGLTPHRARVIGISPVFQEFSLVPDLTVEENLFLGRESRRLGVLDRRAMRAEAARLVESLGFPLSLGRKVRSLSRAHQQMAEIAKALLAEVRVLILDEPTASLTEGETGQLFALVGRLKAQGVGIIYVSHRLAEIRLLADRITVLRDGRRIATVEAADVDDRALIELMTGRAVEAMYPAIRTSPGAVRFEIEGLTTADGAVQGASLAVRAGEVVGVAGLVGCGKSELIRAAFGLERIAAGTIRVDGRTLARPAPRAALRARLCYFPSDRVAEGLALSRAVRENASMAALDLPDFARLGVLRRRAERRRVQGAAEALRLRPPRIENAVVNLSGGNRQKVVLARAMTRDLDVFLLDEPTVGIDVGAKVEVYELVRGLAERGAAIVLVSSELPEVLSLSHRLYVMHGGRVVAELCGEAMTERRVLAHFFAEGGHG